MSVSDTTSTTPSTSATAQFLLAQRRDNTRCDVLPTELMPADLSEAYRVQAVLVAALCESAQSRTAGYKIALTSPTARALCNMDHSVFGRLLASDVATSGASLVVAARGSCVIEVEFGVTLAADVPASDRPWTAESIAGFVAAVVPSIEVVDHHYGGLDRMSVESIVADNAIHGAWIHGTPMTDWQHLDLEAAETSLEVNGQTVLRGAGNRTMDGPLDALAWLANTLPLHGLGLKAGEHVTTGLTTDGIHQAVAGERLVARFEGLGEVVVECV